MSLKNAKISFNYSENFVPQGDNNLKIENQSNSHIDAGSIKAKSQAEFNITGSFFAPQYSLVYLNATLNYSPSNFSSTFQTKNQFGVNVKDPPISLQVSGQKELSSGDEVEYLIDYKNDSSKTFSSIWLKTDYPDNFSFLSASSDPNSGDNLWYLGTLNPGQEGKITVQGTLSGSGGEVKTMKSLQYRNPEYRRSPCFI